MHEYTACSYANMSAGSLSRVRGFARHKLEEGSAASVPCVLMWLWQGSAAAGEDKLTVAPGPPDRKNLERVIDKLQKKDPHRIFFKPVTEEEVRFPPGRLGF